MSKKTTKPAELAAKKVKNVNLLPQVFVTEPNKKMLDSSLDLMTSKGQLIQYILVVQFLQHQFFF